MLPSVEEQVHWKRYCGGCLGVLVSPIKEGRVLWPALKGHDCLQRECKDWMTHFFQGVGGSRGWKPVEFVVCAP